MKDIGPFRRLRRWRCSGLDPGAAPGLVRDHRRRSSRRPGLFVLEERRASRWRRRSACMTAILPACSRSPPTPRERGKGYAPADGAVGAEMGAAARRAQAWLQVEADNLAGAAGSTGRSASTNSTAITTAAGREPERGAGREETSCWSPPVALVDADGRVLLAQRPEGKSIAGLWEFPGGKVEAGETPEETMVRELARGDRRRDQGRLPRAADLRQPLLRDVPSADAALCLPPVLGHADAEGRPDAQMGAAASRCATIRCRRPTRR